MITARTDHPDGRPIALIGLAVEDVERLIRDEDPIVLNLRRKIDPGLPDVDVAVFFTSAESITAMRERYGHHAGTTEGEPRDDNRNAGDGTRNKRRRRRPRRG